MCCVVLRCAVPCYAVLRCVPCFLKNPSRRWICTGTPINNDINDLLGQFSVLHMQPFATKSYFDAYVKHVFACE
jgi:hypothetical protein